MSPRPAAVERRYALNEKTSQTEDLRIKDVVPLPPPEHLIRFFPIAGTPQQKKPLQMFVICSFCDRLQP